MLVAGTVNKNRIYSKMNGLVISSDIINEQALDIAIAIYRNFFHKKTKNLFLATNNEMSVAHFAYLSKHSCLTTPRFCKFILKRCHMT